MKEKKRGDEKKGRETLCDTVIMSFRKKLFLIINCHEGFDRHDGLFA